MDREGLDNLDLVDAEQETALRAAQDSARRSLKLLQDAYEQAEERNYFDKVGWSPVSLSPSVAMSFVFPFVLS